LIFQSYLPQDLAKEYVNTGDFRDIRHTWH
jgi:hypothetical protein